MESVAVVILNYNGVAFLEQFLPAVVKHSSNYEIIVADNHSTDNSLQYLKKNYPEVRLIKLPENAGYTGGYNQALRQVEATYYVLLNSDIEVTAYWVEPIIEMMKQDETIAAAQPKILSYNNRSQFEYAGAGGGYIDVLGYPFCRGRVFFEYEQDHGQYDDIQQVFWATGACLFIRSKVFHEMGGFDEDFFAHMEEIDLCWKINNAGYKVMYNGKSCVYHVGGGTLPKSNPKKTYLNFRNGLSLLFKNYRTSDLFMRFPLRVCLDMVAAVKFLLSDGAKNSFAVLAAYKDFILMIKRNVRKRNGLKALRKKHLPNTIYKGSIVTAYYIRSKKRFEQLNF